jgi:hypothetical protein
MQLVIHYGISHWPVSSNKIHTIRCFDFTDETDHYHRQVYSGFGLDRFHCIQIFLQDRIRSYMNRVKDIQDKANAPKVDKGAAKRFVKSSLWQATHNIFWINS